MITKIKPVTVCPKDTVNVTSNGSESEMLPSTSSAISPAIKSEDKAVQEHTEEVEKEETSDSFLEQENLQMGENKEQESTVVGLDWIEEQIKEKESHFVAEREFSIALDVVLSLISSKQPQPLKLQDKQKQ